MDLHVYRNSQDRWHDLRSAACELGSILAINAVTFQELVERVTPDVKAASPGQRLVLIQEAIDRTANFGDRDRILELQNSVSVPIIPAGLSSTE